MSRFYFLRKLREQHQSWWLQHAEWTNQQSWLCDWLQTVNFWSCRGEKVTEQTVIIIILTTLQSLLLVVVAVVLIVLLLLLLFNQHLNCFPKSFPKNIYLHNSTFPPLLAQSNMVQKQNGHLKWSQVQDDQ